MQQQQSHIGALTNKIAELEKIVVELQMQLIQQASKLNEPQKSTETETTVSEDNIEIKIIEESSSIQKGPLIQVEGD
jgi:hypothetical protein